MADCAFLLRRMRELRLELENYVRQLERTTDLEAREELIRIIDGLNEHLEVYREEAITSGCLEPHAPPPPMKVRISRVEHTQATQTDTDSVPLVAGKDTVLRVYVDHPFPPGTLTARLYSPAAPTEIGTLLNGPISGRRYAEINQSQIDHTLNFRVPGAVCQGRLELTLTVSDPAHPGDADYADSTSFALTFVPVPDLQVWAYLVRYTGPDMAGNQTDIAAPTAADRRSTMTWVRDTYPVAGIAYRAIQEMVVDADMREGVTACGRGWDAILDQLDGLRTWGQILGGMAGAQWIGSHDVFVALVPTAVPSSCTAGGCTVGCGGGGEAAAYQGNDETLAQEIGHALGRQHAAGCGAPNVDPNYPNTIGLIGEHGFDVARNAVMSGTSTFDFMSYCAPTWVSAYTYLGLMDALRAQTVGEPITRRAPRDHPHDFLYLNFGLGREGAVELGPSFQISGPGSVADRRPASNVTLDLVGDDGRVLVFHRCGLDPTYHDPDLPLVIYREVVPWRDETAGIVVRRDGAEIARIQVEAEEPTLARAQVEALPDGRTIRLSWECEVPEGRPPARTAVLFSSDDGASWRPLAFGLGPPELDVDADSVPGGERCRFRILASAGIRTAQIDTEAVEVRRTDPEAFILASPGGRARAGGEALVLEGGAFSPERGSAAPENLVWTSDRDGPIGTGPKVSTDGLSPGRHRITLTAYDDEGVETHASTVVTVRRPDPPET